MSYFLGEVTEFYFISHEHENIHFREHGFQLYSSHFQVVMGEQIQPDIPYEIIKFHTVVVSWSKDGRGQR